MAEEYPNQSLQDFWKTLWHVDVFKDHGTTYDETIINNYLPESKYKTTQTLENNPEIKITIEGANANRSGGVEEKGNKLGFAELFEYLANGKTFANMTKMNIGETDTVTLNRKLIDDDIKYDIKVFDDLGQIDNIVALPQFIDKKIALFVDTASHLPAFLQKYATIRNDIVYAYTREIENDPASKMSYESIVKIKDTKPKVIAEKNEELFYYELPAPANPTGIIYQPFNSMTTKADGLSYFYCKYPVFLTNEGIKDDIKYQLNATLSYIRPDAEGKQQTVTVTEGANTAGGVNKFKGGQRKISGISQSDLKKEIVFISKHHGDVAQSLVKFRDVNLKCPKTNIEINTKECEPCFVSIDVNAIIKALTVGIPFIFMYPPDKDKIIVWKKAEEQTEEQRLESEKKYTLEQYNRLSNAIKIYNDKIGAVNEQKSIYNTKINEKISEPIPEFIDLKTTAEKYKELLKFAITVSTFSKYIPREDLKEITGIDFKERIDAVKTIEECKQIQKDMTRKQSELKVPVEFTTIKILEDDNVTFKAVSFEKETMAEFKEFQKEAKGAELGPAKQRAGINYSFAQGDKRVKNMWESIDLKYNIGDTTFNTLLCRFGTKLNLAWGFDLISYIYTSLKIYNIEYATKFIEKFNQLISGIPQLEAGKPAKIETFKYGLQIVGIPLIEAPVEAALVKTEGGRKIRRSGGSDTVVVTETQQEMTDKEYLYITALYTDLSDMIAHVKLMIDIIYLMNNQDKLGQKTFEYFGLKAYDRFFKAVFGENYSVDFTGVTPNEGVITNIEELAKKQSKEAIAKRLEYFKGGGYMPIDYTFIKEAIRVSNINNEKGKKKEGEYMEVEKEGLDTDEFENNSFITSSPSLILLYEKMVGIDNEIGTLEKMLQMYAVTLRPKPHRILTMIDINNKKSELKSILKAFYEVEDEWAATPKVLGDKPLVPMADKMLEEGVAIVQPIVPFTSPRKRKGRPNNVPAIVSGQPNIFSPQKRTTPRRSLFKGGRKTLKRRKFKTFKKKLRTNKNKTYKKRN